MQLKTPVLVVLPGVFLIIDRFFKWQALHSWEEARPLGKYLAWEPFLNKGIAFGIILPLPLIIILTLFITSSVLYLFYIYLQSGGVAKLSSTYGLLFIIVGAISNLVDRVVYGYTVDYFRIFSSVVNIADGLIITGFVLYFLSLKEIK